MMTSGRGGQPEYRHRLGAVDRYRQGWRSCRKRVKPLRALKASQPTANASMPPNLVQTFSIKDSLAAH